MSRAVRAACLFVALLAACGRERSTESPLAHAVEHLDEHGFTERVRVQREGLNVFVGRAPPGARLPAMEFEDVVFTAGEEH